MQILGHTPVIILLIISAVLTVLADIVAKYWSISRSSTLFIAALIIYAVSTVFFIPTLVRETLIVSATLGTVLATVGFVLASLFIFKESISSIQWVGVVFGIVSVILLSVHSH